MYNVAGLFRLALRRLRSRLGLALLSFLGIALAVGFVTCIPVFTQAVSFVVLRDELNTLGQAAQRPPFAVRFYYVSTAERPIPVATVHELEGRIAQVVTEKVGLPIKQTVTAVESFSLSLRPTAGDTRFEQDAIKPRQVTIMALPLAAEHVVVDEGEPYGEAMRDGRIGVWVYASLANEIGLGVGDAYDVAGQASSAAIPVYIAGIWHARDAQEEYWYENPDMRMTDVLLVTPAVYESGVQPMQPEQTGIDTWYFILDEGALAIDRAGVSANGLQQAINTLKGTLPGLTMDYSPLVPLNHYIARRSTLSALLVGFSLPALGLLLYFLALISIANVQFQTEETAILSARGAGSGFVLMVFVVETLLLAAAAAPVGLLLGVSLARLMGDTLSFLSFVARPPLPVTLAGVDARMLAFGMVLLLAARLVPAWRASRTSIVGVMRERSRPAVSSLAAHVAIDLPLVITSAYAYLHLKERGTIGVIGWEPAGDPFRDPLLLLAPSLFIFTACLVCAHLFPLLVRPLDALSGRLPSFPGYMGLRQLMRQSGQYTSALFLVLVCLSLGAFYSSLALSLDQWLKDHVYYENGADYTFSQGVQYVVTSEASGQGTVVTEAAGGWLLPASDYLEIPGVLGATRVGDFSATANQGKSSKGRFLGIDRLDFPAVAFFRSDFARAPLGELMNRLGMYANGVLVSQHFLSANNLQEGQALTLDINTGNSVEKPSFVIVGVFDYFPTMYPKKGEVFVGNLEYLFEQTGGIVRHSIWLRTRAGTDVKMLRTRVKEMGVEVAAVADTRQSLIEDEDRVERVGLFGVLTIGFLAGGILSGIGLLVYTYASLQGRLGQLSVLRAIGAELRDVLGMVGIEYAGVIAYGIAGGAGIGILASRLFVPFFHFTSDPDTALPPFLLQLAYGKTAAIAIVFAVALIFSQLVILYRLTRKDVFQVLRMGQRQ